MPELVKELSKTIESCDTCKSTGLKARKMYLIKPHGAVADLVEDYRKKICTKCYNAMFKKK